MNGRAYGGSSSHEVDLEDIEGATKYLPVHSLFVPATIASALSWRCVCSALVYIQRKYIMPGADVVF